MGAAEKPGAMGLPPWDPGAAWTISPAGSSLVELKTVGTMIGAGEWVNIYGVAPVEACGCKRGGFAVGVDGPEVVAEAKEVCEAKTGAPAPSKRDEAGGLNMRSSEEAKKSRIVKAAGLQVIKTRGSSCSTLSINRLDFLGKRLDRKSVV